MGILTSSQLTFQKLTDSYSIQVSPDCIALNCDKNGTVISAQSKTINFGTYLGTSRVGTKACVVNNLPTGVTANTPVNATTNADGRIVINIAKGTTLGGSLTASFKVSVTTNDDDSFVFEKYITLIKSVTGAEGQSGADGKMYWIDTDVSSIKRNIGGDYIPFSITIQTKVKSGEAGASLYPSTIAIYESNDGISYTQKYRSSSPESQKIYTPSDKTVYDTSTDNLGVSSSYYDVSEENLTINNATGADGVKSIKIEMIDNSVVLDSKIIPVVSDGDTGEAGYSSMTFAIYSQDGDTFRNHMGQITMRTYAYDGISEIVNGTYHWYKNVLGSWVMIDEATSSTFTVNGSDIENVQTYKCIMLYKGTSYEAYYTLKDSTDIYRSEIKTINGNVLSSSQTYTVAYVSLYKNNEEIDSLTGDIWTNSSNPSESGHYYKVDIQSKIVELKYFNGSTWTAPTSNQEYSYSWYGVSSNNSYESILNESSAKVIFLSSQNIIGSTTIECSIANGEVTMSKCQAAFCDLNDPIVGMSPPSSPRQGQLWVDTSTDPYMMKVYNEEGWEIVKAYNSESTNTFISKPAIALDNGMLYNVGDIWIVGEDYQPTIYDSGAPLNKKYTKNTILFCTTSSATYSDEHWEEANNITKLREDIEKYEEVMKIFSDGFYLFGASTTDGDAKFYTQLSSSELGFWQRESGSVPNTQDDIENNRGTKVVWISNNELHAKETTVEGSLTIVQNETVLHPFIQLGNFKLQIESNESLSFI